MNSISRLLQIAAISIATLPAAQAQICVTKQVACFSGGTNCGTFGTNAFGVSSTAQNPAFCYMITVTNCGSTALTNVSVADDRYGDLTADLPCVAGSLAPGDGCSFTFTAAISGATNSLTLVTNTVFAAGQSAADGQSTTASAQAIATVVPASMSCVKQYTLDGGPLTNNVVIDDPNPHTVVWYVTLNNTGLANFENLKVDDIGTGCTSPFPFRFDAGASMTFAICTNASFTCGSGLTNTVTATATSFSYVPSQPAPSIPLCNLTLEGNNIGVTNQSTAVILCCDTPPSITCPDNITTNAAPNQSSQIVTFAPTVTDSCGFSTTFGCTPPSGSSFASGATTVTCSVTNAAGNTASCSFTVTVKESADLLISKSANRGTVKPGQTISYTITVNNLGPTIAKNVIVNDPTPQGTVFLSATNKNGHIITAPPVGSAGTVNWNLGNLGAQVTSFNNLTVTVLVRGNANIVNTATVTSDTPDPNLANNSATITTRRTTK